MDIVCGMENGSIRVFSHEDGSLKRALSPEEIGSDSGTNHSDVCGDGDGNHCGCRCRC